MSFKEKKRTRGNHYGFKHEKVIGKLEKKSEKKKRKNKNKKKFGRELN